MSDIRIERDMIDVSTMGGYAYDPAWEFTDSAGHRHDGARWGETLVSVDDATYWCHSCRDEHADSHYECRECGEAITPGTVYQPPRTECIPGLVHYYLDGREVSELEAMAAMGKTA